MATISLCMIVKNEEKVLKRCLDSICDLVDEIVIVDTGSTDRTRNIALSYTDKVYDFKWVDDFSAARNFSFSKCSMDYIYVADADEYLDEANRLQFKILKDNIYPEIEIVQMMYETLSHDTVLNVFREYRPKLYKRLREFTWINPVHEVVRLDPLVFDSDIVVTHAPESNHAKRDFSIFEKTIKETGVLSDELIKMYACELYKNGLLEDFSRAADFFACVDDFDSLKGDELNTTDEGSDTIISTLDYYRILISVKYMRLCNDTRFEEYAWKANEFFEAGNSEILFELGEYYRSINNYTTALKYYENAYKASSALDIHVCGDYALMCSIECINAIIKQKSDQEISIESGSENEELTIASYTSLLNKYKEELDSWVLPEETHY